ncbi:MAG TPA: hypothetical protein DGH68_01675 [Bacteroidetes bacterium]|jgi:hypothetical protein|nr:hypothetical protein [Bacteroidota bacterium]
MNKFPLEANARDKYLRVVFLTVSYVAIASLVSFFFVNYHFNVHDHADFSDMVAGRAYKPYVNRMLVPAIVRFISSVTPGEVKDSVEAGLRANNILQSHLRTPNTFELLVWLPIMFASFLGLPLLLRSAIRIFYDVPSIVSDVAPVFGMLALTLFMVTYDHYIYDPATLLLFTSGVVLIASRRNTLFYCIFLLASVNKETSILLIGLFVLCNVRQMRLSIVAAHASVQCAIWLVVKLGITFAHQGNPGSVAEFHLYNHTLILLSHWKQVAYFIVAVFFFGVFVGHGWKAKPRFLREGFLLVAGAQILLAVLFGFIEEIRAYYESFPLLFLLAVPTIVQLVGVESMVAGADRTNRVVSK